MSNEHDDPRLRIYAVMWDCHGLEAVQPIPNPADATFALLKGSKPPETPNLMHWKLRARFNPQRFYEIYVISAVPGIDKEDIEQMFDANPQVAADTIRRIGQCVYSERMPENQIVIR